MVLPLLSRLRHYPDITCVSLVQMMARGGDMGGGSPWRDSLDVARQAGLIEIQEDRVGLAPSGERVLLLADHEGEWSSLREALHCFVVKSRRDVLTLIYMTTAEIEAFVDNDTQQCLRELRLLPKDQSAESTEWWSTLAGERSAIDAGVLKELGDRAERKSLEYERARLREQGHAGIADSVEWVSRTCEGLGFDILSYAGKNDRGLDPNARIRIEVKAMGLRCRKFRFFLTRNEWDVASAEPNVYRFHLWRVSDLTQPPPDGPSSVRAVEEIEPLLPVDVCTSGRWVSCEIVLD